MQESCPVCESVDHEPVLSLPRLPVFVNAQVRPEDAPDVPRGDIELVVCRGCGHLFNHAFDDALLGYDAAYENTLHFSPRFRTFAEDLARRLVDDHRLRGGRVAELGSGPGHFLSMLCEAGVVDARGFDPSYDPHRLGSPEHAAVTISTDPFPADGTLQVDLALSQHVLEHLRDPIGALAAQRAAVASTGGSVYSEVPNGQLMVEHCALWDLIYEHVSYFVPASLELACRRAGLAPTRTETAFGDQFLWCEAVPSTTPAAGGPEPGRVGSAVAAARVFGRTASARIAAARDDLADRAGEGPVALWGAGSKGVTYLNLVADVAPVAAVVDINPRKAGWGVPGTTAVVGPPDALVELRPATVIAANPVYVDEIEAQLAGLGVAATVRPLWG